MLRKFLLLPVLCAIVFSLSAQTHRERIYVKGGPEFWDNFSKEMFLYPSFEDGTIEYKNGQTFKRRLNYNRALGTVQFIDEKHDTLVIASENEVKVVKIGGDLFLFEPVCVQVVSGDKIKLLKSEKLEVADPQQIGALGIPNSTSGISSYNQLYTYLGPYQLSANEVLLCRKITSFYVQAGNSAMVPATKQNILKASGEKANEVKKFMNSKKINPDREDDLLEVMKIISGS
jgi:hypothetical protein